MWPFSLFKQNKSVTIEDIYLNSDDSVSVLLGTSNGAPVQVLPKLAYYLSERNADLGNAVNMISVSLSNIKRGLAGPDNEVIFDHPFLSLLNVPGEGFSSAQFWRELSESFLLTQESWIVARGNISREPLSLTYIRPYEVDVTFDSRDGLPRMITTSSARDRRVYYREDSGGYMRFIDQTKLNELFPIIGAVSIVDEWRGRSPLVKLYYDLMMNTDGKRHNVSLIGNGMRTSGILSPKPMTEGGTSQKWSGESVQALEKKLRSFHQGAGNAGNVLILSSPADLQGIAQNNRDMDFMALLSSSKESIYNMYRIPLPMVLSNAMTLDNFTVANRVYYTKAVFPVYDQLMDGVVNTIGKRFNLPENIKITFNDSQIRDLQTVVVENMVSLKNTEAVSINEIRTLGGFEAIEGGDDVLISSNKVPAGAVSMPTGFIETVEDEDQASTASTDEQTDSGSETSAAAE